MVGSSIRKVQQYGINANIAITNGGGLRASIMDTKITVETVMTVLPFDNQIVVMELSNSDLYGVLEDAVRYTQSGGGGFPQISGITLHFDGNAAPGSKVTKVNWGSENSSMQYSH